jgi:osmotically-inducible protein OsmY
MKFLIAQNNRHLLKENPMLKTHPRQSRSMIAKGLALFVLAATPMLHSDLANAADRSAEQTMDDASITAKVKSQLMADDRTKATNINVDTKRGVVYLKGTADTAESKKAATEVARGVEGVKSVKNKLVIGPASSNPQTASAKTEQAAHKAGAVMSDAWITTKVKTALLADDMVKGMDINVSTNNGEVTLAGAVDSEKVRDRALEIAHKTEGVKSVNSEALKVK